VIIGKLEKKIAKKFGIPGEVKYLSGANKGICWGSDYRYILPEFFPKRTYPNTLLAPVTE
jgi:hypothetical protein